MSMIEEILKMFCMFYSSIVFAGGGIRLLCIPRGIKLFLNLSFPFQTFPQPLKTDINIVLSKVNPPTAPVSLKENDKTLL